MAALSSQDAGPSEDAGPVCPSPFSLRCSLHTDFLHPRKHFLLPSTSSRADVEDSRPLGMEGSLWLHPWLQESKGPRVFLEWNSTLSSVAEGGAISKMEEVLMTLIGKSEEGGVCFYLSESRASGLLG